MVVAVVVVMVVMMIMMMNRDIFMAMKTMVIGVSWGYVVIDNDDDGCCDFVTMVIEMAIMTVE